MALDRLDILVRQARARTGNQAYGDSQGVPQNDFVAFANDAQDRLFNLMMQRRPTLFIKQGFLSTLANTATVALPTDVYIKHNVLTVQFTPNGNAQLYYPLDMRTPRSEVSIAGLPDSYFLRDGNIVLSPMPMTGYANALRITYQYVVPRIDIRRATISGVNVGANTITLAADNYLTPSNVADLTNNWVDYVCIVDKDGTIIDQDRAVVAYDPTTRQITCATLSGYVAGGTFLVFGKNTTTHSALPDICRRYIVEYMATRVQMSDTSSEAAVTSSLLTSIEGEIIDAIADLEEDLFQVTILDPQFLNYADDWE